MKNVVFSNIVFIFALVFLLPIVSASLEITKEPISDVVISELNEPAEFKFQIKNLGESDNFEIYSLVGVDMTPRGTFDIVSGETKDIEVGVYPSKTMRRNIGYITFSYNIRGQIAGIQEDKLTIKIVKLKDAFEIYTDNIVLDSDITTLYVQNKENHKFENISASFSSVFFELKETFNLLPYEKKEFTVKLDKEKFKSLVAGQYILTSIINIGEVTEKIESSIKFVEKAGISTEEEKKGFLIFKHIITKANEGNLPAIADVTVRKNIISRLFTNFNIEPYKSERRGFTVTYYWMKELKPSEEFTVIVSTSWLWPFIVVVLIIVIILLIRVYKATDLVLKKSAVHVRTKGGEFALKVSINVKAIKFVEKIRVIDKLPPVVKLYSRFGTFEPSRIDEKNRRLEWDIESLDIGEERILSYIIYSKIGFVGKFELPAASAIFEREGSVKETFSNKVFFINEPRRREE